MADPNEALKSDVDLDISARTVLSSIRNHKNRLVTALGPRMFVPASAGTSLDAAGSSLGPFIEDASTLLDKDREAFMTAARAYRLAKADLAVIRRHRRNMARLSRSLMITIRATALGTYGPEVAEALGILQQIPRRFEAVLEQSSDLEDRIARPVKLKEPSPGHEAMDFKGLQERFAPLAAEFREAVDSFQDQRRIVQLKRVERDDLKDRYLRTFLWVARIFESLFMMAGLERFAAYVRPSTRRPGLTVQNSQPGPPASGEPGSPEPAEPDGDEPEDEEPDGDEPDGDEPDGEEPDGEEPDGEEPDGEEPDGDEPDGDVEP